MLWMRKMSMFIDALVNGVEGSTVKFEVSHLDGVELDVAVAMLEGYTEDSGLCFRLVSGVNRVLTAFGGGVQLNYSSCRGLTGEIMDREHIEIMYGSSGGVYKTSQSNDAVIARIVFRDGEYVATTEYGNTSLVAALRCYLRHYCGDFVHIPEHLTVKYMDDLDARFFGYSDGDI